MMNLPSPSNPTCIKCGLWKNCTTPFMESSGSDTPEILVIGEAPGDTEDRYGIPFVGKSGELLRNTLLEIGFNVDIDYVKMRKSSHDKSETIRFTNVVRCHPPNNKITKNEINWCSQFAIAEIEKYDPAMVWLLGNSPLTGVLGQVGISQWNGVTIEKNNRSYLPLYHPAYIIRNQNMLDDWLEAMLKSVEGGTKKQEFIRTFPKTPDELLKMAQFLGKCEFISYDTETASLDAYSEKSKIISVSFAGIHDNEYRSYAFPLDHPKSWWSTESTHRKMSDHDIAVQIVIDVLHEHDEHVIAHNTKYDQMHTYAMFGAWFRAGGDSMLVSHLIDSRQGIHGLKRLAGLYLGMYEYEQELMDYVKEHKEANPARGGSYENVPLEILLPYGAMDAEASLMLHDKLWGNLTDEQKILYDELILPVSDVFCKMQCHGIVLDKYIAQRYRAIYEIKQKETYEQIIQDKKVQKLIADKQAHAPKNKYFKFNPNSFAQLYLLYYSKFYYKIPVVGKVRPDGSTYATTSSGALRHLEGRFPILYKVRYYKLLGKMLSTYLRPAAEGKWTSGDGNVRTTYNMHGTVTGRPSSSQPVNLFNIPTAEKEPGTLLEILPIKNIFTHSYVRHPAECLISVGKHRVPIYNFKEMYGDGVVMSADYSGMEVRVFASLAECWEMLKIIESGKDFHSCVAIRATTGKPVEKITFGDIDKLSKAIRYRYKWTNWTLLYYGTAITLHNLYDMPMAEAEQLVADYFHLFPEVRAKQEEWIQFAEQHGYIESPFGRRERLPYINDSEVKRRNADRRSAVNMPPQSAAYDTLAMALVIVDDKLSKYRTRIINAVYDSIMLDVPRPEVEEVAYIVRDVMENIKVYGKEYMPDIDMSWLISPLKADVDVGSHYGALVPLEKWLET